MRRRPILAANTTLDLSGAGAAAYTWYYADDSVVPASLYREADGKFVFTGLKNGDVVYCKMTNKQFPALTLQTTSVTITAVTP